MHSTKLKVMSATAGAGAVLAMGALTVALGAVHAPSDTVVSDPSATLGQTATTTTTAPSEPPTPVATPPVTATTPEGFATP
ncbi:MAG: hypothetical protein QOF25_5844 [Mycobacterium sp.]|nr:hypothetical protein [Mycobacterium sp.]